MYLYICVNSMFNSLSNKANFMKILNLELVRIVKKNSSSLYRKEKVSPLFIDLKDSTIISQTHDVKIREF